MYTQTKQRLKLAIDQNQLPTAVSLPKLERNQQTFLQSIVSSRVNFLRAAPVYGQVTEALFAPQITVLNHTFACSANPIVMVCASAKTYKPSF